MILRLNGILKVKNIYKCINASCLLFPEEDQYYKSRKSKKSRKSRRKETDSEEDSEDEYSEGPSLLNVHFYKQIQQRLFKVIFRNFVQRGKLLFTLSSCILAEKSIEIHSQYKDILSCFCFITWWQF